MDDTVGTPVGSSGEDEPVDDQMLTLPPAALPGRLPEELAAQLLEEARVEGVDLLGPGGLLGGLTKRVLEASLEAEMDAHLGYSKHAVEGRDRGNSRNGTRSKTVLTPVGPVEIDVPRDRDGTFEPKIVAKRQRRLGSVNEMVISLTARGMTTGNVTAHLAEVYGVEMSRDQVSAITDTVLAEMGEWRPGRSTRCIRWCSSTRWS